jgi:hypothetical protein
MKIRVLLTAFFASGIALIFSHSAANPVAGSTDWRVTSSEEGAMEGVLISAKKAGSTIAVTVVSDAQGRYRFPTANLQPGEYALRIRAVGYDLESPSKAVVTAGETATVDLKLRRRGTSLHNCRTRNGSPAFPAPNRKGIHPELHPLPHLERVVRSKYDVDKLTTVIERMSTYPQLSFPFKIQKLVAARIGGGEDPLEQRREGWRRQAKYLSTLNLSSADHWTYSLKMHPRPTGRATNVIYTEYDLPQRTRQPHDVIVDSQGIAWYASFGEQVLGKLDPKSGKVTDYEMPLLKPNLPTGSLAGAF